MTDQPAVEIDLFGNPVETWRDHWRGMPEFVQEDLTPHRTISVLCRDDQAFKDFESRFGPVYHGKWLWYPARGYGRWKDKRWGGSQILPRYPIYVPSKGRWKTPLTIRSLQRIRVPFRVVVETQEAEHYAGVVDESQLLILPHRDKGLVVTRNWIWDHAQDSGTPRFWTFDDNIDGFYRLHDNAKRLLTVAGFLRAMEDFVERYENIPIAGMQYELFATRRTRMPPVSFNTRVYSNMLIQTDARTPDGRPYRNEGFYNDDTDLCLRVLKDGFCTALFNAFLINKIATMRVEGGMTPHYQGDGRLRMAKELAEKHPDVVTVTRKWGRWQHQVDYSPFQSNALRLRPEVEVQGGVNEYGMKLCNS